MVKPSSPSGAVKGAMESLHGKRTGIIIPNKGDIPVEDGVEDMDAFFDAAKTPRASTQPEHAENNNTSEQEEQPETVAKTKPRLSLPGQEVDDEEEETADEKAARVLSRMEGGAISPSDLSRVSTAPPTPASVATQKNIEEEPIEEEEEVPLSPPEEVRASPNEEQEEIAVQQASGKNSPTAGVTLATQEEPEEESFPVDDDDEDDMIPPPPPEAEDADVSMEKEEVQETQEEVDFPADVDEDDFDDDDDKEGDGFAMVHDPETPESVRAERAKEEQEKKKKSKRKKKDASSMAAKSTRSTKTAKSKASKSTAKPTKPRRAKKKVTYATSPTGYPAGNREYEVVPVSDFKDSPEDDGVRRSRRARVKPLAFWKNERPLYGAHHEEGVLGEAMGHMPVVEGYISAQPTPYKKRKAPETTKSKTSNKKAKKGSSSASMADIEEEVFDSRKLRKKYKFIDGEEANMWDETADEIAEQSKSNLTPNTFHSDYITAF